MQESVAVRNAKLNQIPAIIGTSAILNIFSGGKPVNCAASDPTGLLCTINLPVTYLSAASSGSISLVGTWAANASSSGVAASWRIYDSGLVACHIQGNTTDMTFSNANIQSGQLVTITGFTITAGNA